MQYLLAHSENNPRNSEGSFVKLSGNRIMFAYSRYYGSDSYDDCPADICAIFSEDGGNSWSAPETVVRNTRQNVMSVSLLRLFDGRIALHYLEKSAIEGFSCCECRPKIIFSADECETWSEAVDIASGIPAIYFVGNNDRLIQLKSGRLLCCYAHHLYTAKVHSLGDGIGVFFYSDDGGKSWQQSKTNCYPPSPMFHGLMEPGVVELSDGSIYGWFRTAAGCQYKTRSYDGGVTWTAPTAAPEFLSPNSPLSIKRNSADGMLYAVWNYHHPKFFVPVSGSLKWGARTPLVVARSRDNGISWDEHRVIENSPNHGYAYTAIHFEEDKLFLAYCCGGEPNCVRMLQDCKINILSLTDWGPEKDGSDFLAANDPGARS